MKLNLSYLAAFLLILIAGCQPDDVKTIPSVTTNPVTIFDDTSAVVSGTVTSDGGATVTERGIAINITHNPTIDAVGIALGAGTGAFSEIFEGLDPNTTYYIRAYAKNSEGVGYGAEQSFTTTGGGGGGCSIIEVPGGTISTNTTWSSGNVYVIKGNIVLNAVLTIQQGTVIKFDGLYYGIDVQSGSIQAAGSAGYPIIFTHFTDDSYAGDCNGDGGATTPQKGTWGGILLESTTPSSFTYCQFLYAGANNGGGAGRYSAVYDEPSTSEFLYCTFAHTLSNPDLSWRKGALDFHLSTFGNYTCSYNTFYDNGIPIYVDAIENCGAIDNTNIFYDPANTSITNKYQGIFMGNSGQNIGGNLTLSVTGIPYVFDHGYPYLKPGATLNINSDVIIKFIAGAEFDFSTTASTSGQLSSGVRFTSIKDDTGGDSNGDGSLTTPADFDWKGVKGSSGNWETWPTIFFDSH